MSTDRKIPVCWVQENCVSHPSDQLPVTDGKMTKVKWNFAEKKFTPQLHGSSRTHWVHRIKKLLFVFVRFLCQRVAIYPLRTYFLCCHFRGLYIRRQEAYVQFCKNGM